MDEVEDLLGDTGSELLRAFNDLMPDALSIVTFAAGATIFCEGDDSGMAYLVERGSVRLSRTVRNADVTISTVRTGELFGELCLVDGFTRGATATALEHTELLAIGREQMRREVNSCPPIVKMLVRELLRRRRVLYRLLDADDSLLEQPVPEPPRTLHDTAQLNAVHEIRLEQQLREAVGRREFELHYQPIVDLETRTLAGLEALVRWARPDEGILLPDRFIDTAERTGLIVSIGAWVMEDACHFARRLHTQLRRNDALASLPFVSVNVSPVQLATGDSVSRLLSAMTSTGVDCDKIKIEITENVLIENPAASAEALGRLKAGGASIAVDDFGTGYASLSCLPRYPIDTMKIDRSFVMDIDDAGTRQVIQSMIVLASGLGMDVVAEGVETDEQMMTLRELGCRYGQGFLFARPSPAETVVEAAIAAVVD